MEGLWCYRRDDRHASINHMFVAKHTKFPLSHSAKVSLSSHPVLSCSELHSAANGSKWAFSFSPLLISLLHHSSSCYGIKTIKFFLLFTLDQIIKLVCFHAYDKSSTISTSPAFSGAMIQEKYLHSSHPTHFGYGCQKYLRPQSTRERQDAVKQQNASKVSEVTLLQIFWSPFRRRYLQSLKICESFSWDVSAFLASFLTAVTQQTYFTWLQQLSAGLPHSPGYFCFDSIL